MGMNFICIRRADFDSRPFFLLLGREPTVTS